MNRSANSGGAANEDLVAAALDRNPDLEERHVREATRFLDRKSGVFDEFLKARLRGVDYRAVLQAYLAVERLNDAGPREPVLRAIRRRLEFLENIGDRDQRGLAPIERDAPPKVVRFVDRLRTDALAVGERVGDPNTEVDQQEREQTTRLRAFETTLLDRMDTDPEPIGAESEAVATDGGSPE